MDNTEDIRTAHCDFRHFTGSHTFEDAETGATYLCHGHNQDGSASYTSQGKVYVECTCGLITASFRDNG